MHFYPHHVGDYRSATAHLSNQEDLAYRRLLEMYYDTERPISADTQWVSRRLRVGSDELIAVLNDFFVLCDDGYHNARCDIEIAQYTKKAHTARANGKKGGRRKLLETLPKNPVGSNPEPMANPGITQALANQEPRTKNQEPHIPPIVPHGGSASFDQFWSAYPRKIGKGHARQAFAKAIAKTDTERIIDAARRFADTGPDLKFTPHPATWLNGERWTDEITQGDTHGKDRQFNSSDKPSKTDRLAAVLEQSLRDIDAGRTGFGWAKAAIAVVNPSLPSPEFVRKRAATISGGDSVVSNGPSRVCD